VLSGLTPLDFMLQIMRNPDQDLAFRAEMAKATAPYIHQKLIAADNTNRFVPPRTDKSIAQLTWRSGKIVRVGFWLNRFTSSRRRPGRDGVNLANSLVPH
jgi:hypothetical protein